MPKPLVAIMRSSTGAAIAYWNLHRCLFPEGESNLESYLSAKRPRLQDWTSNGSKSVALVRSFTRSLPVVRWWEQARLHQPNKCLF